MADKDDTVSMVILDANFAMEVFRKLDNGEQLEGRDQDLFEMMYASLRAYAIQEADNEIENILQNSVIFINGGILLAMVTQIIRKIDIEHVEFNAINTYHMIEDYLKSYDPNISFQ